MFERTLSRLMRRSPISFAGSLALAANLISFAHGGAVAFAQQIAGCSLFPADSIWNARVDSLPLDPASATYVNTIGADTGVHADFGSGEWPPGSGAPIGIPFVVVPASQPSVPVSFLYDDESDPGPYPIPPNAPIEGGAASNGDRHVLVLESGSCALYELFYSFPQNGGTSWTADSGAVFDLDSYALRPDTWTSADAAGLPILPGLVRYEEVEAGAIEHALRFTVPQTRRAYVWPARHFASSLTGAQYPPMGQRFRLRSDFDLTGFSPRIQVILQALKEYGMMLADNGSAWFLSGAPDDRWDNDELRELLGVVGSDFEAVDVSSLMADPDSSQTAPAVPCTAADQMTVMDTSITGNQVFRACDEILGGPNVSIFGPNGYAVFSAGNRVVFSELAVFPDATLEVVTGLPLVSE
ncbi:MAG: hypothetical protein GY769_25845 [bacterium]|nr:hypothetical protein [bacterium]